MKHMDLFSGIGGFSLGFERAGMQTVAFCEENEFCQKVLKKHWPDVPIFDDVRTMEYDGPIDIISGGWPCQPYSTQGEQQGEDDDRALWPAMFDLIKKHRPLVVVGENVAGHISLGLDDVLSDLEREGYSARTFVIPAIALNAKHRRDRVWIVAYLDSAGHEDGPDISNTHSCGFSGQRRSKRSIYSEAHRTGQVNRSVDEIQRPVKSPVCRRTDGISAGLDKNRLMGLGNAALPQITERIANAILVTLGINYDNNYTRIR